MSRFNIRRGRALRSLLAALIVMVASADGAEAGEGLNFEQLAAIRSVDEVVVAPGGAAALQLLERDSAFDMVLCDLMMPDVDGPMVYATLEERWPKLAQRMVFVSGGAFTQRSQQFLDSVARPLITKPIRPDQLVAVYEQLPAPPRKPKA